MSGCRLLYVSQCCSNPRGDKKAMGIFFPRGANKPTVFLPPHTPLLNYSNFKGS